MSVTPLVSLVGISKSYGSVRALSNVSLDLRVGEVHVLLGENGAGKSTLAALLAGVQQPDEGSIRIDGVERRLASPRDSMRYGVGVVFQHPKLVPSLTLVDNIALGHASDNSWWRTPSRCLIARRMREAEQRLTSSTAGLDPLAIAGSLSLGERQRAQIVAALMRDSRLLVLDEPTSMLTPEAATDLLVLMRRLADDRERPMAIVVVTHKLDEALGWGDRITVLRRGQRVGEWQPDPAVPGETARRALLEMMFASGDAMDDASMPARALHGRGEPVLRVEGMRIARVASPVEGIDLVVRQGEIVGVAGIDGNGQRELAEALAGQRTIDGGDILLDGVSVRHLGVAQRFRRGLRYGSDDRLGEGSVGRFSIGFNLLLKRIGDAPFWRGGVVSMSAIDAHARRMIATFDIRAPGPETPVAHLSGGNLQKVVLARELDSGARAIVLAKPTHGLDVRSTYACRTRIREAARAGLAVVLISTDLDEILELADRIMVMSNGRIVARMAGGEDARASVARAISHGGQSAEATV